MASEITAAQYGAQGKVRRDPMAMLPFCGYNMADYFKHWLETGKKIENQPKIFNVNWFRTGSDGNFLWPGYGDNLRVLEWIIERCRGSAGADKTPIGFIPKTEDLDQEGMEISRESMKELLRVDNSEWIKEAEEVKQFYSQFGSRLPEELKAELGSLIKRLK